MRFTPYPLYQHFSCIGYQEYLEKVKIGNQYQFSGWFFLFNIFWLVRRRMYLAAINLCILVSIASSLLVNFISMDSNNEIVFRMSDNMVITALISFTLVYTLLSFLPFKFYHQHCLNKIDYTNKDPIHKLKPLNFIATLFLGFVILFLTGEATSLIYSSTIYFLGA